MKKLKTRLISIFLLIFMFFSLSSSPLAVDEFRTVEIYSNNFDGYNNDSDFSTNHEISGTYSAGNMQFYNGAVRGNIFNIYFWNRAFSEKYMYFDADVFLDENCDVSVFSIIVENQTPATAAGYNGSLVMIKKGASGVYGLYDNKGNLLRELKKDGTIYKIHVELTHGQKNYSIYLNDELLSDKCEFYSPLYIVKNFVVHFDAVGDKSYISLDKFRVYTKGRAYPQLYSYQEPGEIPNITIPSLVEQDGIEMWVNREKKECDTPFILEDDTIYFPYEWLTEAMKDNKKGYILDVESSSITRNGKTVALNNPIKKAENGTIYVPAQFIAEAYDAKVWLDEAHEMLIVTTGSQKKDDILRNNGSVFIMNGEPYYEISFNKYDLNWQILAENHNGIWINSFSTEEQRIIGAEEALSTLHENGFKSIRVFCSNINLNKNQEELDLYWEGVDKMFDLCDKYDIKLVVCLGLTDKEFLPGLYTDEGDWVAYGEDMYDFITNPESQARENLYNFIDAYVSRYKDRKTVLMWEIQNEGNLLVDSGHITGNITYSILQLGELSADIAERIKMNDPERLVSTGDSKIRENQWTNFEITMSGKNSGQSSSIDNMSERLKALILINKGVDVMSIHGYNVGYSEMCSDEFGMRSLIDWEQYLNEAKRLGMPLYNGETGGGLLSVGNGSPTGGDVFNSYPNAHVYRENYLNKMIDAGVQLTHWWTFNCDIDYSNFDEPNYSVRCNDSTKDTFFVVKAANEKLRATYLVNPLSAENTDELGEVPDGYIEPVETDPVEADTEKTPETTPETTPYENSSGCKSVSAFIIPAIIIIAALPVIKKRKI